VRSSIRESLCKADGSTTRTVRYANNNERRYKTLPLHPSAVPGTPTDLNWGARNKKLGLGMDALPTAEGEMVSVLLFKPDSPIYKRIETLPSAQAARGLLEEALPELLPYVRDGDLERFVKQPVGRLPSFQLVEGPIHASLTSGGLVLLGDAIKAVKPYFGQGANSALEDVLVLRRCLDSCGDDPSTSAAAYSANRAEDARALVSISRGFDHPGLLGTARFLLPLLLDIQLHKALPALFSPPLLRGLQDERYTFSGLRATKRRERLVLIAAVVSIIGTAACRPMVAVKAAYIASGVGLGYGGTKFMRFASSGGLSTLVLSMARPLQVKLRDLVLRLDPSLAEEEGKALGLADLRGPFSKGQRGRGGRPSGWQWPPWRRNKAS